MDIKSKDGKKVARLNVTELRQLKSVADNVATLGFGVDDRPKVTLGFVLRLAVKVIGSDVGQKTLALPERPEEWL